MSSTTPHQILFLDAASRGNINEVCRFLDDRENETGVSIQSTNLEGQTALHLAVLKGHNDLVRCLLDKYKADANLSSEDGHKPLHYAVEEEQEEVIDTLISFGAEVDSVNEQTGATPLHTACALGSISMAEILIENNANIEFRRLDGFTPLFIAAAYGHEGLVECLLKRNADRTSRLSDGRSPEDVAGGNEAVIKLLKAKKLMFKGPGVNRLDLEPDISSPPVKAFKAPSEVNKLQACHRFEATVMEFSIGEVENRISLPQLSVYDLLYGPNAINSAFTSQETGVSNQKNTFTWYHLPANNMTWVETLITRLIAEKKPDAVMMDDKCRSELGLTHLFEASNQSQKKFSSFQRPLCRRVEHSHKSLNWGQSNTGQLVAFLPLLHYEAYSDYEAMSDALQSMKLYHKALKPTKKIKRSAFDSRQPPTTNFWTAPMPPPPPPPAFPFAPPPPPPGWPPAPRPPQTTTIQSTSPEQDAPLTKNIEPEVEGPVWPPSKSQHVSRSEQDGLSRHSTDPSTDDATSSSTTSVRKWTRPFKFLKSTFASTRQQVMSSLSRARPQGVPVTPGVSDTEDNVETQEQHVSGKQPGNQEEPLFTTLEPGNQPPEEIEHEDEIQPKGESAQTTTEKAEELKDATENTKLTNPSDRNVDKPITTNFETATEEAPKKLKGSKQDPLVIERLFGRVTPATRSKSRYRPKVGDRAALLNPHIHLIRGYSLPQELGQLGLQPRRTLDQYFYSHLDNTSHRDQDQVIYRYTKKYLSEPKIFMVDQLWLWILNDDTIISCCPLRWQAWANHSQGFPFTASAARPAFRERNADAQESETAVPPQETGLHMPRQVQNDPMNPHQRVLKHLRDENRKAIRSVYDLAGLITSCCVNTFDEDSIPEDYHFFAFFEHSIGDVNERATKCLKDFRQSIHDAAEKEDPWRISMNVAVEMDLLVEIEDIQDELNILHLVLTDQINTVKELSNRMVESAVAHDEGRFLKGFVAGNIDSRLAHIKRLQDRAQKARESLYNLIDLKQKQANFYEAAAARMQAEYAASQTEEAARQSKTFLVFTVVTIVFLPLSFMAAFFAIPLNVFPTDGNQKLELGYVLKYMLSIGFAAAIPFVLLAFKIDDVSRTLKQLREAHLLHGLSSSVMLLAFIGVIFVITVPVIIWTSQLAVTIKIAVTICIVILLFVALIGFLLKHLMNMPGKAFSVSSVNSSSI